MGSSASGLPTSRRAEEGNHHRGGVTFQTGSRGIRLENVGARNHVKEQCGITPEMPEHLSRPAEGGFGVDYPVLPNTVRRKDTNRLGSSKAAMGPWKQSFFCRFTRRYHATNLPRKTRLSTFTGRRKVYRGCTHRVRSGENPPAGMAQCTCGWTGRFCPNVCKMLRNPISAPRCLGSAATSSSVAALA
jgi:hypothetical protein